MTTEKESGLEKFVTDWKNDIIPKLGPFLEGGPFENNDAVTPELIIEGIIITDFMTRYISEVKKVLSKAEEPLIEPLERLALERYKNYISNELSSSIAEGSYAKCKSYTTILEKLERYPNYLEAQK